MIRSPAPPAPAFSTGWSELLITLAIQAIASMAILTLPVVATIVGPAVGLSPSYAGVYIGLLYVGCTAGSLAAGAAVERWGPVRVSQSSLVLGAIGLALCCSGVVAVMVLGTLLMGLGYGQVTPASSHLLARSSPPHRMALMFSLKQTGVPLGGMMAGALVPGLMLVVGWRVGLACVALACLACALMAQVLRARLDAQRDPLSSMHFGKLAEPLRMVFRQQRLKSLALCSIFLSSVQMCLTTYTVIYLTSELGFGLVTAGFALSVCQLAGVTGRIVWGYVADRALGAMRVLALLSLLIVVCCIGMALLQATTPRAVILMLLALFGATAIGWNGVFLAEVARQAPTGFAGLATGGVSAFTFFGAMIAPPLFALMSSLTGSYRTGYVMLAVPMVWCGWLLWRLFKPGPVGATAQP